MVILHSIVEKYIYFVFYLALFRCIRASEIKMNVATQELLDCCVLGQLYVQLLIKRIIDSADSAIDEEHCGFKSGRGF